MRDLDDPDRFREREAGARSDLRALESEVARESVRQALFGQAMPRNVGRYRVERRCGRGAMGAVFEAHDPELDRRVALKLLERRSATPAALERLERQVLHEARAMARLHHPAVAAVYEVGRHGGWVFLAMEFVAGQSLRQWLRLERPSWRRIVDVFHEVGQGLVAAHDAGLAHGDFKPDNLRFDESGRLRILDFGLARSICAATPATAVHASSSSAALMLSTGIEGFGGTPVYAAPERIAGNPSDERSDQFAFFVSLYEAIHGRRPFTGATLEQLRRAIARGPRKPRGQVPGPKSLRQLVDRGLSEDPTRRFESMADAVAALGRIRSRRPRQWWLLGGLTLAAGAAGWALAHGNQEEVCPDPEELVAGLWGGSKAEVAEARPAGIGAAPPWPKLESELEGYVRQWAEAHAAVCRSGEMRQDPDRGARHLACLGQRRAGVERLLQRLARGEARSWATALEAVTELPDVHVCDGAELPGISPPEPGVQKDVDELRERLVVARVDADGGDLEKALQATRSLVARARALSYAPVLAEALMAEGKVLADLDHLEDASGKLRAAYGEALASGHAQVAADTAVALIYVDGYQRARADMGHHWAWVARHWMRAAGHDGHGSSLIANEAAVFFQEGRLEEADAGFREAIELEEASQRPDPFVLDGLRHNRGTVAVRRKDFVRAVGIHREVLEARRELYGDDHPKVAKGLSSLAAAERGLGRLEDAMAHELEALRRLERIHGPDSPALHLTLTGLAETQLDAGVPERSARTIERLLAILEQHLEPDHPNIDRALQQLAVADMKRCRYDDASARFERVLERLQARPDQEELLATIHHNLGELRLLQGRHAEAQTLAAKALATWEARDRELAASYPRTALGMASLAEGRYADAHAILQSELALRERLTGPRSLLTAEAAAGLGRALVGLGRLDEGIAGLRRALDIYAEGDAHGGEIAARMRAAEWLAEALLAGGQPSARPEAGRLLDEARRHWVACGDDRAAARVEPVLARLR